MAFSGPSFPRSFRGRKGRFPGKFSKDEHRINERIRVPQVRLIDEKGGQVGVVDTKTALQMAKDRGLDLMEVAPNSNPPVCKITDYGKYKYEKKKKDQAAKKKQATTKVKEVQLRPRTGEHDREFKYKNCRQFLENGDKVKVTMLFRGREMAHTENGRKVMNELVEAMKDVGTVEAPPKMEGRRMIMIITPLGAKAGAKKSTKAPKPAKPESKAAEGETPAKADKAAGS